MVSVALSITYLSKVGCLLWVVWGQVGGNGDAVNLANLAEQGSRGYFRSISSENNISH
jgi:hypothetical protein